MSEFLTEECLHTRRFFVLKFIVHLLQRAKITYPYEI